MPRDPKPTGSTLATQIHPKAIKPHIPSRRQTQQHNNTPDQPQAKQTVHKTNRTTSIDLQLYNNAIQQPNHKPTKQAMHTNHKPVHKGLTLQLRQSQSKATQNADNKCATAPATTTTTHHQTQAKKPKPTSQQPKTQATQATTQNKLVKGLCKTRKHTNTHTHTDTMNPQGPDVHKP